MIYQKQNFEFPEADLLACLINGLEWCFHIIQSSGVLQCLLLEAEESCCIDQGSPEKQNSLHTLDRFWGISSCSCDGWEVTVSAICKLETQESRCVILAKVWKPEIQESQWYSGPQWIRWCFPTLRRATYFTEPSDSNTNLIWKHFHRAMQKYYLIWAHLFQSSWHMKLTTQLLLPNSLSSLFFSSEI